jgi:hypothetical protein
MTIDNVLEFEPRHRKEAPADPAVRYTAEFTLVPQGVWMQDHFAGNSGAVHVLTFRLESERLVEDMSLLADLWKGWLCHEDDASA